jgi:hypothetical protein
VCPARIFQFPGPLHRSRGRPERGGKAVALRRMPPRAVYGAGNLVGEQLSNGFDQQRRAVGDCEPAAIRTGHQVE